jgi:hypothetical protein
MNESNMYLLNFIISLIVVFVAFILIDMYNLTFIEYDRSKNVSEVVTIEKYINKNLTCKQHID